MVHKPKAKKKIIEKLTTQCAWAFKSIESIKQRTFPYAEKTQQRQTIIERLKMLKRQWNFVVVVDIPLCFVWFFPFAFVFICLISSCRSKAVVTEKNENYFLRDTSSHTDRLNRMKWMNGWMDDDGEAYKNNNNNINTER